MNTENDAVMTAVVDAIRQVLHDTGRETAAVEPGRLLSADIGLDSLDLAQTVVLLERSLGVDPFRVPTSGAVRPAVRTVADLVGIYRQSVASRPSPGRS
jgi:acyl carrier protein